MSESFSISNERIQNAERKFTDTVPKMETADRPEKIQNDPVKSKDSISFSGEVGSRGAQLKVNQAENAAEADPKLPSTQKEQYHSTLNVMA
jgi:hypothetical protein